MEKEGTDLPAPPFGLVRPTTNPDTNTLLRSTFTYTSSSNSSNTTSSSSSSPASLRQLQAAYKRHRPLGTNNIMPRRMIMPRRDPKASEQGHKSNTNQDQDERLSQKPRDFTSQSRNTGSAVGDHADYALSSPPMDWGYSSNTHEAHLEAFDRHDGQPGSFNVCQNNASNNLDLGHLVEGKKRVHFASENEARSLEMECDANASNYDLQHDHIQSEDVDNSLRPDGAVSSSMLSDQRHQFRDLVQDDMSHPMSQSSLINPDSAPILNSTTYSKRYLPSSSNIGTAKNRVVENNYEAVLQGDSEMKIQPTLQTDVMQGRQAVSNDHAAQLPCSKAEIESGTKLPVPPEGRQTNVQNECNVPKNPSEPNIPSVKDSINSCGPPSNIEYSDQSDMKLQSDKTEKLEAGADAKGTSKSRKKSYDPELFFKVNGKLYQRLGKIGSGGSSEVHKVISSDCTIYALKKIKLKGRDYATAYGFCQEILYLTKLKGKNYIIQLIDYEVTDKALLQEVINGSQGNKDARVKVDGFIYMVLEYGEIDLAHMLSNKWKELDKSSSMIDENWLRFYWQQILLAVNTIHEERIVHSDLKPANFLLVRGSLKLIDFGIAKAIMSDTTNIQRDSQVGTLSYMSPEAFMCNETDANGNTIKCGRASDIWSLGCILYQMVYGRTPFSEYKTFWAKFKVITDPNHEITYEPVSNPWLLDLMKKCLSWDRNQRWRIPQLLQHPFLVPPIPPQITSPPLTPTPPGLRQLATMLSTQLEQLLMHPTSSLEEHKLLCDMSNLCLQLKERVEILGKGEK